MSRHVHTSPCSGPKFAVNGPDFNPVLPEDSRLVESNGLSDAWLSLHPDEPGYIWGVYGLQRFPPNRLDKVATLGLEASSIRVLETQQLGASEKSGSLQPESTGDFPFWSDHHGLLYSFGLAGG